MLKTYPAVGLGGAVDDLLGHVVECYDVPHHADGLVEGTEPVVGDTSFVLSTRVILSYYQIQLVLSIYILIKL